MITIVTQSAVTYIYNAHTMNVDNKKNQTLTRIMSQRGKKYRNTDTNTIICRPKLKDINYYYS